mmetsp:Transcript_11357/g.28613  ORF Transcript_11357/g.28613 Transcript_11357/m.28613 type:complete len:506 (-) Transcript_11357:225-1742(-)
MPTEDTPAAGAAPAESAPESKEPAADKSAPEKEEDKKAPAPDAVEVQAAATAEPPASGDGEGAPPAKEEEVVEKKVVEEKVDESTYGIHVDPASSFDIAREVARNMHKTLGALKVAKADADASSADAGEGGSFSEIARTLQLQLLSLRRAHRAMAKAADAGRTAEALARRVADAEFAHLETRRYESACCRAAARRCRSFPAPELSTVRPFLHKELGGGAEENEAEDQAEKDQGDGKPAVTRLTKWLEIEGQERARLAADLQELELEKASHVEAFRDTETFGTDLTSKLQAAELALEPVCNLLELRPRPDTAAAQPEGLSRLPSPLRLVYSKFDMLATFGMDGGVTVKLEAPEQAKSSEEPPEKKPRVEASVVRVGIAAAPGKQQASDGKVVTLCFACPPAANGAANGAAATLVGVSSEDDALLETLWADDDGRTGGLASAAASANVPGRAYGWAQVLAGLRDRAVAVVAGAGSGSNSGGPLAEGGSVVASDIVQRVRDRLSRPAR